MYSELRTQLATYLSEDEVATIDAAHAMAEAAHEGQTRRSGEPYITHPIAVAAILANLQMDYESIAAALLHDTLEDTKIDKATLVSHFNQSVADLVDGVSKLTQIEDLSREEAQAENFRKMMLAMAQDIRVILIKLADRLHNMRTLGVMSKEKQRRIARETLEIFAPIAHRLGMHGFKIEFEELGFQYRYPMRHAVLAAKVQEIIGHRADTISHVEDKIAAHIAAEGITSIEVSGRQKHLYSLYQKMLRKRLSFSDVMDFLAFRVVVDTRDECYRVLGLVHALYRPMPLRFKDYIAIPKGNGYQSMHTTLIGPHGLPIEVQIRTLEMHRFAENGIASHWLYKQATREGFARESALSQRWLQGLLDIQKNAGNPLDFIENVKIDLHPDEVYVFTPKGKILALPQGATPVDFAYQVHTDLGNMCVASIIDRKIAPLSARLRSGQTVEIVTNKQATPNPAWLSFTVTGKARASVRHFLKSQKRLESMALGRRLLNSALGVADCALSDIPEPQVAAVLKQLDLPNLEALCEDIGLGNRVAQFVAMHLLEAPEKEESVLQTNPAPLKILGTEGLVVTYAKCCYPIPGDPVVGIVATGEGVEVHMEQCPTLKRYRKTPEKLIAVTWSSDVQGEFKASLIIDVENDRGVLGLVASTISETNANIHTVAVENQDESHFTLKFVLMVRDRAHFARIMKRLRRLHKVVRIQRGHINKRERDR